VKHRRPMSSASPGRRNQDEPPLARGGSCLNPGKSPPTAPFPATGCAPGAGGAIREALWRRRGLPGAKPAIERGRQSRRYSRMSR
jgi:hypothetical protein